MAKQRWKYLPVELANGIIRMAGEGKSYNEIHAELGVFPPSIRRVLRPFGGVGLAARAWTPAAGQLTMADRIEIYCGIGRGESFPVIARALGRSRSGVWREVTVNGGKKRYHPEKAHRAAQARAARPKPTKLANNPELCRVVTEKLEAWWSPEQIADWLRVEYPDRSEMWVSHETIYKSLYVQGRGELRKELAACLRTGRAKRKTRGSTSRQGSRIKDMVMISERPAEVEDRAVPGHWEGDLIVGTRSLSAVGTLVERTSRYVMLLHLDGDHTAARVREAMTKAMAELPAALTRSVTWDQGTELAEHAQFTIDTDIDVFFCDPHAPWQRGSNENTNGLLRQYMPKGTDLSVHTPADLQRFADSLNTRPRKTLGGMTPLDRLAELVAAAA